MFGFRKKKGDPERGSAESQSAESQSAELPSAAPEATPDAPAAPESQPATDAPGPAATPARAGLFGRMRTGLARTRQSFSRGVADVLLGEKQLDTTSLEEVETQLLLADVGVEATQQIVNGLTERLNRRELEAGRGALDALRAEMLALLTPVEQPLVIPPAPRPFVILVVGVNGAGKTTTIGKLARRYRDEGLSVMLAAGDTFRAAAVEQLQQWGERNEVPVIAQRTGADSAAVVFDALQVARSRGVDVLIADTAGRLHTQSNLMAELAKVKRVMARLDPEAPHETLLVLDAGNGQNALSQARQFAEVVDVTGIALTKLDGTARGGIVFAIARALGLPVRFVGVGEGVEDLRSFSAEAYVAGLLDGFDSAA